MNDLVNEYSYFEDTHQPLNALQVFVRSGKLEIYPPLPVIGYLERGIHEYLEAEGKKRLDECLGLVSKPGVENHFSKWKRHNRDMKLRQYMILLRKTFNLTVEMAAGLVSKLPNSLKQETLEHRFKKDKTWKAHRQVLEPAEWFQLTSIEAQQNFLKIFPYDSLPNRLKPLHPKGHT